MPSAANPPPDEAKMPPRARAKLDVFRTWAVLVAHTLALLVLGTIPGSMLHPLEVELSAPSLPADVSERPASLEVLLYRRGVEVAPDAGAGKGDEVAKGEPVAEARVRAFTILEGRAYTAADVRTRDGHAELTRLPVGEHWIVAEAEGLARASRMVMLVPGARSLELVLGPAHALDVVVVDEAGAPVPGADVEVQGQDPFPLGARSDAEGRAHVTRLSEGPYTVVVSAMGFDTVETRKPSGTTEVRVVVKKLSALVVTVVGPDGAKVPKSRVEITSAVLWPSRRADTDDAGNVRISGLAEGTYALRATHGALASPTELAVTLARGETKELTLHLSAGMWVTVRVVEVDGESRTPLAGSRVVLAESGLSAFPVEGVTGKDGTVALGPIPRGGASVMASHDGYVSATVAVSEGPVDVGLVRAGTLVGRVVDGRGYAVDGARIEVVGTDFSGMPVADDPRRAAFRGRAFDAALSGPRPLVPRGELGVMPGPLPDTPHGGGGASASTRGTALGGEGWLSERDGRFRLWPVTPGRVRVVVRHPQFVEAQSELVELSPGGTAEVQVTMRGGGTLEGRVVDSHDRAVEGAEVVAMAMRGTLERMTRTDRAGAFAFASVPEDVVLVVERPRGERGSAARVEARVPEGGRAQVRIVLPDARDDLPVRVVDSRGDGIDGAQITVGSLDPSQPFRATVFTDKRGEATLAGARGVPLHVEVRAPHVATRTLTTQDNYKEIRVELAPAEAVEGEVRTPRRDGIDGASVTLYCDDGAHRTRTDKDGNFVLRDAPAGACRLQVRAKGYAPRVVEVAVLGSRGRRATTVPRVTLEEEAVVEGLVIDPKGQPVPLARVAKDAVPVVLVSGTLPPGVAETDARGRFRLGELPSGLVTLEAFAPGRGQVLTQLRLYSGRTTKEVKLTLGEKARAEPEAKGSGGVAVTLGERAGPPAEVGIVTVVEGSSAERAGLAPGDVIVEVSGVPVHTIAEARGRLTGPLADDVVLKVRRGEAPLTVRVSREEVRR